MLIKNSVNIINSLKLVPPTKKFIAYIGIVLIINKATFVTVDINFPKTIFIGDRLVESKISNVCLSLSPVIDVAVSTGTININNTACPQAKAKLSIVNLLKSIPIPYLSLFIIK